MSSGNDCCFRSSGTPNLPLLLVCFFLDLISAFVNCEDSAAVALACRWSDSEVMGYLMVTLEAILNQTTFSQLT